MFGFMPLTIHRIIVHYLDKQQKATGANIDYSTELLEVDDFAIRLITELHQSISDNSSIKNASFEEEQTNSFTTRLNEYLDDNSDDRFKLFSKSLDLLKEKIENRPGAKGGYYLFADYNVDNNRFISVVVLRKKSGINIVKYGERYKLDDAENINIEKVAMAARLNYSIFTDNADNRKYLAVITTQSDGEVSGYFKEWILAAGMIKNAANTDRLLRIIKSIDEPYDENGQKMTSTAFKRAVYEYGKSAEGKKVSVFDLSAHFYGEENRNAIRDFADAHNIQMDPIIKFSSKWKDLITIRASVEGISLEVDFNKINNDEVDLQEDHIVIRNANLAALLRNRHNQADNINE